MVSLIPEEYKQVEYVELNGTTTAIDTGVNGNNDKLIIELTYMSLRYKAYADPICGNYIGENYKCWRIINGGRDESYTFTTPARHAGYSTSISMEEDISTILNKKVNITIKIDEEGYSYGNIIYNQKEYSNRQASESDYTTSDKTIYIGCLGANYINNDKDIVRGRLYNFKIYDEELLIRSYIPCIRKSDNKVGLYDLINKTFNSSIGMNEFIAGPELPYQTDMNVIRKKIIAAAPHIETVESGNTSDSEAIAHFKTDLAAPIKSLKINFSPIQEGSGDPSSDNIREIKGWDSIELTRCGKNLLHSNIIGSNLNKSGINININRDLNNEISSAYFKGSTTASNWFYNINYQENKHTALLGNFTLSTECPGVAIVFVRNYSGGFRPDSTLDNSKQYTMTYNKSLLSDSRDISSWYRFEIWPRDATTKDIDGYVYPMIRFPEDDEVFEPYNGQTIIINLPSTSYKGYVDLINGEVVITHKKITLSGEGGSWLWNCYTITVENIDVADSNGGYNILACSHTNKLGYGSEPYYSSIDNIISISQGKQIRYRDNSKFTDLESAQSYIQAQANAGTPIQIVAKLAAPIHYSIDSQALKTLRGINNIWSTANDKIELSYWTH